MVADIKTQVYLKKLGQELSVYSKNPFKNLNFFMLNDDSVGPIWLYWYVYWQLLSSESELAVFFLMKYHMLFKII